MNLAESETGVDVGWNGGCSVGGCHPFTMTVFSSLTAGVLSLFSAMNTVQRLDGAIFTTDSISSAYHWDTWRCAPITVWSAANGTRRPIYTITHNIFDDNSFAATGLQIVV